MSKDQWTFVGTTSNRNYKCGLKPGDKLRLRAPLKLKSDGRETGEVISTSEVWTVLAPTEDQTIVWLREPGGDSHTWDDSDRIHEDFEIIGRVN